MNNTDKIVSNLKDFSIQPPDDLYQRLAEQLFKPQEEQLYPVETTLGKLKDLQITPTHTEELFKNIYSKIALTPQEENLSTLKDNKVAPPTDFFRKIWLRITGKQQPGKVVSFTKRAIAAAAVLLVLVAAWWLITFTTKDHNGGQYATSTLPASSLKPHVTPSKSDTGSISNITPGSTKTTASSYASQNTGNRRKNSGAKSSFTLMQIEDEYIKIKDNDILTSFASFTSYNVPSFVFDESQKENVKLRVDNSTAISISEGMLKMMRKMYGTKRNGKPTHKAKRIKKRITKWQKADKAYFDVKPGKNPFDPIDLGDLIF